MGDLAVNFPAAGGDLDFINWSALRGRFQSPLQTSRQIFDQAFENSNNEITTTDSTYTTITTYDENHEDKIYDEMYEPTTQIPTTDASYMTTGFRVYYTMNPDQSSLSSIFGKTVFKSSRSAALQKNTDVTDLFNAVIEKQNSAHWVSDYEYENEEYEEYEDYEGEQDEEYEYYEGEAAEYEYYEDEVEEYEYPTDETGEYEYYYEYIEDEDETEVSDGPSLRRKSKGKRKVRKKRKKGTGKGKGGGKRVKKGKGKGKGKKKGTKKGGKRKVSKKRKTRKPQPPRKKKNVVKRNVYQGWNFKTLNQHRFESACGPDTCFELETNRPNLGTHEGGCLTLSTSMKCTGYWIGSWKIAAD